jgi:hypothetical protein
MRCEDVIGVMGLIKFAPDIEQLKEKRSCMPEDLHQPFV